GTPNSAARGRSCGGITRPSRLEAAPIYPNAAGSGTALRSPQHDRGVDPAETKRVREDHVGGRGTSLAAQAIEIAGGVRPLEVDGGGKPASLHGERADRRFDRATRTEGVAVIALGATDAQPVGVVAEHLFYRGGFGRIVER